MRNPGIRDSDFPYCVALHTGYLLAGVIMRGGGFGLLGDIVVGIVGAVLGGYLFGLLGISVGAGLAGPIVTATVGAMALLFVIRLIKRA